MAKITTLQKPTLESQNTTEQIHTSVLLRKLIDDAADVDFFTVDWLIAHLPKHSFGVIMLFLALISLLPIISVISRLMILVLALQIIFGSHRPVLPQRLMTRPLSTKYLSHLDHHAIPALRQLERAVRPRWPTLLKGMRRFVAFIAVLLVLVSLVAPIPFANMPPAIICVMISLAYIEHDGMLLLISTIWALIVLGVIIFAIIKTGVL